MDKNGLKHARTCVYNVNYHIIMFTYLHHHIFSTNACPKLGILHTALTDCYYYRLLLLPIVTITDCYNYRTGRYNYRLLLLLIAAITVCYYYCLPQYLLTASSDFSNSCVCPRNRAGANTRISSFTKSPHRDFSKTSHFSLQILFCYFDKLYIY